MPPKNTITVKFPIEELTDEKKYQIAETIAHHCANLPADTVKNHSKFYFREIINSDIIVAGQRMPLAQAFTDDIAMHITNLVLTKLQAPRLVKTVASVEI